MGSEGRRDMSYELKLERLYDASPEVVFDAFVDPATQAELHGNEVPDWKVSRAESDVRVGGTATFVMGVEGQEPDTETRVFTVIDRPHRLVFRHSMQVAEWGGRTVDTEMTITFEDRDGKTLLTMVQTGFEREEDRDDFLGGWPTYLDTLKGVVTARANLKTRHD
jgi:uncharacterized protein YndB with AHSA1/START domain